jgi:hypothetical protein
MRAQNVENVAESILSRTQNFAVFILIVTPKKLKGILFGKMTKRDGVW